MEILRTSKLEYDGDELDVQSGVYREVRNPHFNMLLTFAQLYCGSTNDSCRSSKQPIGTAIIQLLLRTPSDLPAGLLILATVLIVSMDDFCGNYDDRLRPQLPSLCSIGPG